MLRVLILFLFSSLTIASQYKEANQDQVEGIKQQVTEAFESVNRPSIQIGEELEKSNKFFSEYQGNRDSFRFDTSIGQGSFMEDHYNNLVLDKAIPETQRSSVEGDIFVFVSFSMTEADLISLGKDLVKINGKLVFNGFKDDLETTMKIISRMNELAGLALPVMIDPTLFERFEVERVPVYVIPKVTIQPCISNEVCEVPDSVKASGLVPVDYFLEKAESVLSQQEKVAKWLNILRS